ARRGRGRRPPPPPPRGAPPAPRAPPGGPWAAPPGGRAPPAAPPPPPATPPAGVTSSPRPRARWTRRISGATSKPRANGDAQGFACDPVTASRFPSGSRISTPPPFVSVPFGGEGDGLYANRFAPPFL